MTYLPELTAKSKWCPWSRVAEGSNRFSIASDVPPGTRCMASACMAWDAGPDLKTGRCALVPRKNGDPGEDRRSGL